MRILWRISFVLAFSSCIEEYHLPENTGTDRDYVVNGILYPDSIAKVYLSILSNVDESPSNDIADARIVLTDEITGQIQELDYDGTYFLGQTPLLAERSYTIEIETVDGKEIFARTSIPTTVELDSSKLLFPAGYFFGDDGSGPFQRANVAFADEASTENFYEVLIVQKQYDFDADDSVFSIKKTRTADQIILAEGYQERIMYSHVFSDTGYDGKEISLGLEFTSFDPFGSTYVCILSNVSKEYYEYKKSLYNHLFALSVETDFETSNLYNPAIFKSLDPLYSNIDGGKGIFAAVAPNNSIVPCNLVGNECR